MSANHTDRAHSELGGSIAKRWIACPGSVRLCRSAPPQETSSYAEEGTAAHELGESCLLMGEDADDNIGEEFNDYVVTDAMAEAVQVYLDYVNGKPGAKYIERKFDLGWVHEGMFGSNDCCIYAPEAKHLDVVDYKHGQGITVGAEWNTQLLYYAAGAVAAITAELQDGYAIETLNLAIVQPRGMGQAIKEWELDVGTLNTWVVNVLMPAARETDKEEARLEAGDHCRFCPAAAMCPEQMAVAQRQFLTDGSLPVPENMSAEEVGKRLDDADILENYIKMFRAYAKSQLYSGQPVGGRKLVAGRNTRKWTNDLEAADKLESLIGEDAYARKLLTPAAAEKAVGSDRKGELKNLIETHEGQPVMALESSKKAAVCAAETTEFLDACDELN